MADTTIQEKITPTPTKKKMGRPPKKHVEVSTEQQIRTDQKIKQVMAPRDTYKYATERERDQKPVKGIFRFYEVEGGNLPFVYKKYKGEKITKYDLHDGEIYTIPLGVAKHLNTNGWYPIHAHALDDNGKPSVKIGTKKRRFGFQSLEFVDDSEYTSADKEIVTVERI